MGTREGLADVPYSGDILHRLIDASREAIKIIDLDGRIVRWNPSAEELYGWREAEVLGRKLPHVPEETRLRAIHDIRSVAASGRSVTRDAIALRKDGTRLAVRLSVIPTTDHLGNGTGVLSVVRHAGLSSAAEGERLDLACALAEELRSPLTTMLGYAQLLARPEIASDAARRSRTLRSLEECGTRLSRILDDVVVLSQAREGDLALDQEPTELAALVTDAVARVESAIPGSRFVVDFDSSVPPLRLDRHKMGQAVAMLLSEAASASSDGVTTVSVLLGAPGFTAIDISATVGRVQPEVDVLPFTESIRLHAAGAVIRAHGGTLTVDQEPDRARVSLRLPVQ